LLHSKTEQQWQFNKDKQTRLATEALLQFLVESKRVRAQKQSIKSVCLMLQNRSIAKMPLLLVGIQALIQDTISADAI